MNARQKAKHYKRLYEQSRPQYVVNQFVTTLSKQHYKVACRLPNWATEAYVSEEHIVETFLKDLKPVIKEKMQCTEEPWGTTFSLDLWI